MNQVKSLDELAGKTVVKAVRHGDNIAMLFSDQSVAVFVVDRDYDEVSVQIDDEPTNNGVRLTLGIISQSEYIANENRRREADKQSATAHRRRTYEALRQEFDNEPKREFNLNP